VIRFGAAMYIMNIYNVQHVETGGTEQTLVLLRECH
jgi:hypothetical protein